MNIPETQELRAASKPTPIAEPPFARYIPLALWMITIAVLLLIPLKILSLGYLPAGDARRHIAKVFTDKPYKEIIAFNSYYMTDQSPGWEWLLRFLHRDFGFDLETLVAFSVASLMLCVFYAPLPWLRRPEAWLAALLAQMIAIPEVMTRFAQARPYLITEGVLIAILFAWSRRDEEKPSWPKLILTTIGITLSVWMHGTWYLWMLPIVAFCLAQRWRTAGWLAACFAAGTIVGALLTGNPIAFLEQQVLQVIAITREHLPQWMLVGEFRPSYGEFATLALIGGVILWRWLQSGQRPQLLDEPVFCMIVLCWVLGFKGDRFWADWGVPAVLVWLTMQFEEILPPLIDTASAKRVVLCGLIAAPLFLHATNDLDRRYTFNLNEVFLDAKDPSLKGWLPEHNGLFYFAQMDFFYNTFYKNPQSDWRYVLAMEPAMMRPDDLQILRQIQRYNYNPKAYEPWIEKMTPADRLVIYSGVEPPLPRLEWHNAIANIWIGRLPKAKN
ncbi:MAG TPA: hypothetical protein VFB72_08675 [Verrucomicrobiae bacterium]|nr:hypothetical protein [Verrucomicrobiae bacterium]